jgi:hypothetical protein
MVPILEKVYENNSKVESRKEMKRTTSSASSAGPAGRKMGRVFQQMCVTCPELVIC